MKATHRMLQVMLLSTLFLAPAWASSPRRAEVRISRWDRAPRGVVRQELAQSQVRIEAGGGSIRLGSGASPAGKERIELRFQGLDSPRPTVRLVDLGHQTPASPELHFTPGESVLRVSRAAGGYTLQSLLQREDDILEVPPPGAWEVELGAIPSPVQSLWGQHLAVATLDGQFSFLPPIQ